MKQVFGVLFVSALLSGCSEDLQPVPARCVVDVSRLDYGTVLPPDGGPVGIRITRQITITNKPELTSPAGNEHLRGSLTVLLEAPQTNPPDFYLSGNNIDPDFDLALRETILYELETVIHSNTSTGVYSGIVDLGGLCTAVPFSLHVAAPPEDPPVFDFEWGSDGSLPGQFKRPSSIAVDSNEILYVVDQENLRVQKFAADGTFLAQWDTWEDPHLAAQNPTIFLRPVGVAVDPEDLPYVSDVEPESKKPRVTVFDPQGDFIFRWGPTRTGEEFPSVFHLDINALGHVYLIDQESLRIRAFELKEVGTGYNSLLGWGLRGTGPGRFRIPYGLAIDPATGDVFVSDWFNNYVQRFSPEGRFLLAWGEPGEGPGQFDRPTGIDTDAQGNLYVTDNENRRIQKFNGNGAFLTAWGLSGTAAGQMSSPVDIAIGPTGLIYVVDQGNDKILRFSPP